MKIKSILDMATKCTTQAAADKLLDTLQRTFGNAKPLCHLGSYNAEAYMEGETPFVQFELNHEISDHYITMIRPEIRNKTFVVVVVTNHMRDGLGMVSKSWEPVEGMENVLECDPDITIAESAKRAKALAVSNHATLIERVGVSHDIALDAAEKCW